MRVLWARDQDLWGDLSSPDAAIAVYYVQWTVGAPDHRPNFDLLIGCWGDGASRDDRALVSLEFQPGKDGGFMVIDASERRLKYDSLCAHAMRREDIVGSPSAKMVFDLIDAMWEQDSRLTEVRSWQ